MTAQELLMPRFEVIEEYPNCTFKKGDILKRIKRATDNWYHVNENSIRAEILLEEFEKFPHLFKKLNWWEYRNEEDMPKKVMSLADDKKDVYEIEKWDMEILVGWTDKNRRECCSLLTFNPEYGYIPVD